MSHPSRIVSTGMAEDFKGHVDKLPDYDPKTKEHFWIATVAYKADVNKLKAKEQLIFDSANLVLAGPIGCYHCERGYEERLTYRPCPGDPAR